MIPDRDRELPVMDRARPAVRILDYRHFRRGQQIGLVDISLGSSCDHARYLEPAVSPGTSLCRVTGQAIIPWFLGALRRPRVLSLRL
jgi:hypothetical protein